MHGNIIHLPTFLSRLYAYQRVPGAVYTACIHYDGGMISFGIAYMKEVEPSEKLYYIERKVTGWFQ
jgi:hypothetical protein